MVVERVRDGVGDGWGGEVVFDAFFELGGVVGGHFLWVGGCLYAGWE